MGSGAAGTHSGVCMCVPACTVCVFLLRYVLWISLSLFYRAGDILTLPEANLKLRLHVLYSMFLQSMWGQQGWDKQEAEWFYIHVNVEFIHRSLKPWMCVSAARDIMCGEPAGENIASFSEAINSWSLDPYHSLSKAILSIWCMRCQDSVKSLGEIIVEKWFLAVETPHWKDSCTASSVE